MRLIRWCVGGGIICTAAYDLVAFFNAVDKMFASEEALRSLLQNVSHLLKPGGFFFG